MNERIEKLNKLLGDELGWTLHNEPLYCWSWSNDLYWPAMPTGKVTLQPTDSGVLLPVKEYVRMPLTNKRDVWIITKWTAPETLHGWEQQFPWAPRPARGIRVHTDWYNAPGVEPTLDDTQCLIKNLRIQGAMTRGELMNYFAGRDDKREKDSKTRIEDEVEELIPAFVNAEPGKRGGHVSVPFTKFDR